MAIGDPWDTTYNPRYSTPLKNERTGMQAWMPDASDEVSQDDPLSLQDRRKGRFCTEGCGCIDTMCSNLAGHKCTLPPEIAITILRTPDSIYLLENTKCVCNHVLGMGFCKAFPVHLRFHQHQS